jgi:type IV secretory pathway TraG/TraD family ATPase VirD4
MIKVKYKFFLTLLGFNFDVNNNKLDGISWSLWEGLGKDGQTLEQSFDKNHNHFAYFSNNQKINVDQGYDGLLQDLSSVLIKYQGLLSVVITIKGSNKEEGLKAQIKHLQLELSNQVENKELFTKLIFGKSQKLAKEEKLEKLKVKLGKLFYTSIQILVNQESIIEDVKNSLSNNHNLVWSFANGAHRANPFNFGLLFNLVDIPFGLIPNQRLFLANSLEVKNLLIPKISPSQQILETITPVVFKDTVDSNLDQDFLTFSNNQSNQNNLNSKLSLRQVYQNIIAFGDPGSGKTVGALSNLIKGYFVHKFGMLVTVYKEQEAIDITSLASQYGREKDLVILGPQNAYCTNILEYEYEQTNSIKSVVELVNKINSVIKPTDQGANSEQDFWNNQAEEMLDSAVRYAMLDGSQGLTIENIEAVILTAVSKDQVALDKLNNRAKEVLFELQDQLQNNIIDANSKVNLEETLKGLIEAYKYWTKVFPAVPEKQINSVMTVVKTFFNRLKSGVIAQILFAPSQRVKLAKEKGFYFKPDLSREGKIIILNYSKEFYKETGATFQRIVKMLWQDSLQRNKQGSPCVLVSDEFQEFASSNDADILATARSYRIAFLVATQNITSLKIALGDLPTEKLLGNIQTKIFHKTSDTKTIEYAQALVGKAYLEKVSDSVSGGDKQDALTQTGYSKSSNFELTNLIEARHMHDLNTYCDFPKQCQAIYFSQGQKFGNMGLPVITLTWNSIFASPEVTNIVWARVNQEQSVNIYPFQKFSFFDELSPEVTAYQKAEEQTKQEIDKLIKFKWFELSRASKLGRKDESFFEDLLLEGDPNIKEFWLNKTRVVYVNIINMLPLDSYKK